MQRKNANAKLVTPSKVGMKIRSNISPGMKDHVQVVPLYIWADGNSSKYYKACIQLNGDQFGYIPLNDLKLYHGPEVTWQETPSIF